LVANQLPAGTLRPILGPVSSRMGEVFQFVVQGDGVDPMELRSVADWVIRYRLLGVPGISFVVNLGGFIKQYQVMVDPTQLKNYGITIADVKTAIEENNYNPSGGLLFKGPQEFIIRGLGRMQGLEHIRDTVITARNNVPVYVKDIAEVKVGHQLRRGIASRNGQEVVDVVIEKQYGGNTLTTIHNVKNALANLAKSLPNKIKTTAYYDQSILIWSAIGHVERALIEGAILVILVILLFMGNLRAAFITSLTIPISVLFAIIMMKIFGIGITVMSLGGLAIGIGKMANSSVIMVENIYRIMQKKSKGMMESTLEGAKEIGRLIFHASIIIILVFIPLFGLTGIEGRMFEPTAFAVAASLVAGLLCSLTIQPVVCSLLLKEEKISEKDIFMMRFMKNIYKKALDFCLEHRWHYLLISGFVYLGLMVILIPRIGREFLPHMDEGSIILSTILAPGTSLEESDRIGKKVESIMLEFPEVLSINRTTGRAEQSEHAHGVNHSHYIMELLPRIKREHSLEEMLKEMRARLDEVAGLSYIFEQPIENKMAEMLTGIEGQIAIKLFGPELEILDEKIEEIESVVENIKGVTDLRVEQTSGTPEINVRLNRKNLARYGLNIAQVSEVIETALNGIEATDILEEHRKFAVFIRFQEKFRKDIEAITNLLIDTPSGQRIPLSELADFEITEGPLTIMRENVQRRRVIICNVTGRDQGSWVAEASKAIEENITLPAGYYLTFGGQFESQQRSFQRLILLSIFVGLIVFFLLMIFFSFKNALTIMINVPFSMMSGVIALFFFGMNFNVSSAIGFIALFGISIQNAFIMVGFYNNLRKQGVPLREAVIQGSLVRLRPVLITEMVIIMGVLPLLISFGASGSEILAPLAVVYIGGELDAIFLAALQLPILYELFEGRAEKKKKLSGEISTT
jgi:cobalt-zinc-cadmium resistance protein CzcA